MNIFIIYRVFHLLSNKSYIGKCSKGLNRVKEHFKFYKNPNYEYRAKLLYRAMKKHGVKMFRYEILCEVSSLEELNIKEKEMILKFDSKNPEKGYNIRDGGEGGNTYDYLSDEEKTIRSRRISEATKKSYTEERKLASSQRLKKMRKDPSKTRKNSEVCSERMKRLNQDPEFRLKLKRNKKVKCIETGEIFNTIKELSIKLNIKTGTAQWYLSKKNGKIKQLTYVKI